MARVDVERTRLSASTFVNFTPKTVGPMRIRPGSKYLGSSVNDTGAAWIEFVASASDAQLIELTKNVLRVWDTGDALLTRPAHTTTTGAWSVSSDTGSWKDSSEGGGYRGFGDTGLVLDARTVGGTAKATCKLALGDTGEANAEGSDTGGIELGLAVHIVRGPVQMRLGTDTGLDDIIAETTLRTGYYSLGFVPTDTGGLHLTFSSDKDVDRIVGSVAIESAGTMTVTTPWGADNLDDIRYAQSADVVFVACYGIKPMRIERHGAGRSWSCVEYLTSGGPFFPTRSNDAKLRLGATYGNTTLEADKNTFDSGHVGALFRVLNDGQGGTYLMASSDAYSDVWKVTGINDTGSPGERRSLITASDTGSDGATDFNGRLSIQRSFEGPDGGFRNQFTFTDSGTRAETDSDDNITVWYRMAIRSDTGDYVASGLSVNVLYEGGAKDGVCRVIKYNSPTSVDVEVLSRFAHNDSGNHPTPLEYSADWAEGRFSDAQTWPSSVALHEGRLWWFGGSQLYGSVSDDYENFNAGTEGDSAPIVRTLNTGPVDRIHWAVTLLRLFIGTASEEIALRSTSLDEPLTPTNMAAKSTSTIGSANLRAIRIDDRAIFVNRAQKRVFMIAFNAEANDYRPEELTLLVPDLLSGVQSIAVQRQPDTRVHCVLSDGSVAIATYEAQEQVLCWSLYKSTAASGAVEKVAILPGQNEDKVYYHVRRTINGSTKRYLERQATEAESVNDTGASWLMDCGIEATISDTGVATGLDHLEGEEVIVWRTKDLSYDDTGGNQTTYTVSSGIIQLGTADTGAGALTAQIGLPYIKRVTGKEMDAEYQSTKLAYGAAAGTALTMPKRVDHVGLILGPTHNNGLFMGTRLDTGGLQRLPRVIRGRVLNDTGADANEVFSAEDLEPIAVAGNVGSDERLCLGAKAPRIATAMAAVVTMQTTDKL